MRPLRLSMILATLLLAVMLLALLAGHIWVPLNLWMGDDPRAVIIAELRAPRIILGALVGGALGLTGAVMQGYLRNPLADPGLFGVSSGAALGAVTAIFFGFSASLWVLPSFALLGAAASMALLGLIAGRSGSLIVMALGGVMLSSLTGSLTALLISLAPNPFATSEIISWMMGALTDRSWRDVAMATPLIAAGGLILAFTARPLDMLTLGEAVAQSLGVRLGRLQWQIIAGLGLCVGAAVAVAGVIGFVGLIVPHIIRPLVGNKPSALLAPSALGGAILVVVADAVVRSLPTAGELRLGIAMAVLGTPFFFALLMKLRRGMA